MEKLTDDEHRARAMLLGMRFHRLARYYFYPLKEGRADRLDADTLEPVSIDEAAARIRAIDTVRGF